MGTLTTLRTERSLSKQPVKEKPEEQRQNRILLTPYAFQLVKEKLEASIKVDVMTSISIRVGDCAITPTRPVRNLGAHFDSRMNMEEFIIKKGRACQLQLHKIARIHKYLSNDTCSYIIQGLVTSKLDYANCLLYEVNKVFCTDYKLNKIQQTVSSSK